MSVLSAWDALGRRRPRTAPSTERRRAVADLQIQIGSVTIEQVYHNDSLTGPQGHFGCLLFTLAGRLVRHDGNKAWMYTGAYVDNRWVSFVREFDLDTLQVGARSLVLPAQPGDLWATIHTAIQVRPDLTVAFFSTSSVVKATMARHRANHSPSMLVS